MEEPGRKLERILGSLLLSYSLSGKRKLSFGATQLDDSGQFITTEETSFSAIFSVSYISELLQSPEYIQNLATWLVIDMSIESQDVANRLWLFVSQNLQMRRFCFINSRA